MRVAGVAGMLGRGRCLVIAITLVWRDTRTRPVALFGGPDSVMDDLWDDWVNQNQVLGVRVRCWPDLIRTNMVLSI